MTLQSSFQKKKAFKHLFSFHLEIRDTEIKIFHPWFTPPNTHNRQAWGRLKPGAQNSIHVSCVKGKYPRTRAVSCCLPQCALTGSWTGGGGAGTHTRHFNIEYRRPWWHPNAKVQHLYYFSVTSLHICAMSAAEHYQPNMMPHRNSRIKILIYIPAKKTRIFPSLGKMKYFSVKISHFCLNHLNFMLTRRKTKGQCI